MTKENKTSWEEELLEMINGDWELMELNPGKPYRTGMKEVHFIKFKALISNLITLQRAEERERIVKQIEDYIDIFSVNIEDYKENSIGLDPKIAARYEEVKKATEQILWFIKGNLRAKINSLK